MKILMVGDIVGSPGRTVFARVVSRLRSSGAVDFVVANAENAAGGSGLTPQIYSKLLRYGVDLVTLGDHAYRKREIISTLETEDNIVRPANFSEYAAGKSFAIAL